jgi:hypothetical protein
MEAGTQFIGIKPEINMAERKSNVANNPTDVFTIEDIAAVSRPYKVYTALLTQDGEGNQPAYISSSDLAIGVTYKIIASNGADFTNVGSPNNDTDTYFVATGTTPNSWGEVGELLYDASAPVVTVLENTIGYVYLEYINTGEYVLRSSEFIENNTAATLMNNFYYANDYGNIYADYQLYPSIYVRTVRINSEGIIYEMRNSLLSSTPIEIRVYN